MNGVASERVLVFAPRGRDAELTCQLLAGSQLDTLSCQCGADLVAAISEGAGCAVVTSEGLRRQLRAELATLLTEQPPWSDFPIVVLTGGAKDEHGLDLGNMTILERPVAPSTLIAAVRAALRGRRRQYDARAAIHQRDQFLAMLGHELRNPLAAIMLATENLGGADRSLLERRIALISRQATHLGRLVNDLLDVARVTSGKLQLQREAVDIDAVIRSCVETLESRARERNLELVLPLASHAVIDGDAGRLEQVIGNLLTNAIKYSPPGRTITVSSARVGACCEIRVLDQGIGIAPEMLPRVFDLFAQADASLDRSDGGLGIGLALVDRLVRLHGGTAAVTSGGLGTGSEFIVRLPIGDLACEPASSTGHSIEPRRLRVVIVEDNLDLLELTATVLEHLGCHCDTAADGEAGLDLIRATSPDLALIDVGLPKLDGYGVAEQLRREHIDTKLVAVTGYGQRADRERALAAGFDEHITKPVRATMLQQLIDTTTLETRHA